VLEKLNVPEFIVDTKYCHTPAAINYLKENSKVLAFYDHEVDSIFYRDNYNSLERRLHELIHATGNVNRMARYKRFTDYLHKDWTGEAEERFTTLACSAISYVLETGDGITASIWVRQKEGYLYHRYFVELLRYFKTDLNLGLPFAFKLEIKDDD